MIQKIMSIAIILIKSPKMRHINYRQNVDEDINTAHNLPTT